MPYRRLGSAGVKVSLLSFGSWVTFDTQVDDDLAISCLDAAYQAGVNFFDNAEAYAGGESEAIMGRAINQLGWPRHSYLISTKFFFGIHDGPNTRSTLNRKYLLEAVEQSAERLQHDVIDLIFCHRADPETPMEELVHTMHEIVSSGRAYYWGTSEWSAAELREAWDIAEKYGLHKPQMEQPQYNMLARERVEVEYEPLYDSMGLGTTIWSPLSSGLLTGKYRDGVPDDSRAALKGYEWLRDLMLSDDNMTKVAKLQQIADDLEVPLAQLALAWCASNPRVSTVITGASKLSQVEQNMAALDVLELLTPEVKTRIDEALS
ncbi:MAG: aldo/keto reductase [Acidimicrobiales bacterium]|nr:aldo/keto reductase [Acidimicrobiales bacterium]